jgi:hypothetical protein
MMKLLQKSKSYVAQHGSATSVVLKNKKTNMSGNSPDSPKLGKATFYSTHTQITNRVGKTFQKIRIDVDQRTKIKNMDHLINATLPIRAATVMERQPRQRTP